MSEKTQNETAAEAAGAEAVESIEAGAQDRAEASFAGADSFAGAASFADAESREILNLLGDGDAGGSCCSS